MAQKKKENKSAARKQSKVPTKIMTYGTRPVTKTDRDILVEQVFQAHKYRRRLIEIETTRRTAFRALRRTMSPALNDLEAKVDALESRIQEERKGLKAKKLRTEPEQLERLERIRELKTAKKALFPQISAEQERLKVVCFEQADKVYQERKDLRLKQAAERVGRQSVGPNSTLRTKVLRDLFDEMLKEDWPDAWKAKLRLEESAHKATLLARKETLCHSGTYLKVEEAVQRAKKDSKRDPRQRRFDHTGMVAIQLTKDKGLPVRRALSGTDERLRITLRPDIPVRKNKFAQRALGTAPYRQAAEITVKLAGTKKNAVFVTMSTILHRPLPDDGIIKWFQVYVDRIGYETVYECQFVLESETFRRVEGPKNGRRLAVNFGWRPLDGGVRVATAWDGERESFVVLRDRNNRKGQAAVLDEHKYAESLLGFADRHFDVAISNLTTWLKEGKANHLTAVLNKAMPRHQQETLDTIPKMVSAMGRWRAHEKLRRVTHALKSEVLKQEEVDRLWAVWVKECKAGGRDLFCGSLPREIAGVYEDLSRWFQKQGIEGETVHMALYLQWWVRKEEHLINWARRIEAKLQRRRREVYRTTAALWAHAYETVTIEKWNKSETAEVPEAEDDMRTPQEERANANRQHVGISVFVNALKEVLGPRLIEADPMNISVEHYQCGGVVATSLSPTELLVCPKCQRSYDQDVNAARHLWDRERSDGGPAPVTSRTPKINKEKQVKTATAAEGVSV